MTMISLRLNGQEVSGDVEPRTSVGEFVREHRRLTGTHLACEHGVCGACTILLDGMPVRSCITYAVACQDREIRTIEGFEDDELMDRLRKAFREEHGLQCGMCTPGMLIAARDLCLRLPGADEGRIRTELSGNICRCTGYLGIVRAVQRVAKEQTQVQVAPVTGPVVVADALPTNVSAPPLAAGLELQPAGEDTDKGAIKVAEQFTIPASAEVVWRTLGDLPSAVKCLPGAELLEYDGRTAKGQIKVKFGPMAASFSGTAAVDRDEMNRRARVRGAGTDKISNTRARGELSYALTELDTGKSTRVEVVLSYSLVGPLAQFSRSGIVREFVRQMTQHFSENLKALIENPQTAIQGKDELNVGRLLIASLKQRFKRLFGHTAN